MQNGTPNGINNEHEIPGAKLQDDNTEPLIKKEESQNQPNLDDEPPFKKRKLAGSNTPSHQLSPRPVSPPWKRIAVDGPTSFVEDGRRKSSRTNAVPLDLRPQSGKRQTRAAILKVNEEKGKNAPKSYTYSPHTRSHDDANAKRPASAGKATQTSTFRPPSRAREAHNESKFRKEGSARKTSMIAQSSPKSPTSSRHSLTNGHSRGGHGSTATTKHKSKRRSSQLAETTSTKTNGYSLDGTDELQDFREKFSSPIKRIKFKVKMPTVAIEHLHHLVPKKEFGSFKEWFEKDQEEPRPGQDLLSGSDTLRRAEELVHVREALQSGGLLADSSLRLHHLDPGIEDDLANPEDPPRQYGHYDHLIAHAIHFRKLLDRERADHIRKARQWSTEVIRGTAASRIVPKTEAELEQEAQEATKQVYRRVTKDIEKQWLMVAEEVNRTRLADWQKEQEALGKQQMNRLLEKSTQLLDARQLHDSDGSDAGSDDLGSNEMSDSGPDQDAEDEDESNMSDDEEDGSEDEDGLVQEDADADLTLDAIRSKYGYSPATYVETPQEDDELHTSSPPASDVEALRKPKASDEEQLEMDESAMDDSDPSIDMESDITDSAESDDDNSEESNEISDEDEAAGRGLLGFFGSSSRKELVDSVPIAADTLQDTTMGELDDPSKAKPVPHANGIIHEDVGSALDLDTSAVRTPNSEDPQGSKATSAPDIVTQDSNSIPKTTPEATLLEITDVEEVLGGSHVSRGPSSQASPGTLTTKESEVESFSSVDAQARETSEVADPRQATTIRTPIPSLLRGTLREYQHYGLDWLARLYAKHTNGILADEMGLGKTIQSIALLAHLAVEHEVWGPHLIIVPTSVMLNWEMEFKKWCPGFKILTYYGTQEERKAKRRGWLDDDLWNVCITSYQLVLQDQVAFKRRNWHYMILDEAHNIKNFRSQRWQTLLGFKTRARLLLTGTPLQNNLTELWSLLFFLQPSDLAEEEGGGFAGLRDFSEWFRKPVDQILEHGRDTMDDEARQQVAKLHKVIRPYLLRRLKADVEKQMPGKYEHVELCRLSKRQRQLYDGFMSRAQTKETLASGNYLSIINCLMQLRKVCNHPDLFETRPVTTSFAMPRSATSDFEIQDLLVRRKMLRDEAQKVDLAFLQLAPVSREDKSAIEIVESSRLMAGVRLQALRAEQYRRTDWQMSFNGTSTTNVLASMENVGRKARMAELERTLYSETYKHSAKRIYGRGLLEKLTFDFNHQVASTRHLIREEQISSNLNRPSMLQEMILSVDRRASEMEPIIEKFACLTPAVVSPNMAITALADTGVETVREAQQLWPADPFHEARTRLSIAFPDKRLLQYDCGKLQRLDLLLRQLQAGGHRALIFTQMTKVLDILEQFLNIHGHRYLRLDGSTKIEQRQGLTDRFNNDTRILAFILSSRSGGLGINLTGADTVIFYDLDWNPAMDKQCQDRAHRIGQTRDVHIYRFVSEHTIESNILRKSNQKRMLDDVIIQEGEFTTDYFNKMSYRDMLPDVADGGGEENAAMDRILGNSQANVGSDLAQAEDTEDVAAAKMAEKEVQHADDGDFDDKISPTPRTGPQTPGETTSMIDGEATGDQALGSIDDHMLRIQAYLLKDVPVAPPASKNRKRKRGQEHRMKRPR